jgi:hypothetical protein
MALVVVMDKQATFNNHTGELTWRGHLMQVRQLDTRSALVQGSRLTPDELSCVQIQSSLDATSCHERVGAQQHNT